MQSANVPPISQKHALLQRRRVLCGPVKAPGFRPEIRGHAFPFRMRLSQDLPGVGEISTGDPGEVPLLRVTIQSDRIEVTLHF